MKFSRIKAILATVAALALSGAAASNASVLPETKPVLSVKTNLKVAGGSWAEITEAPFAALLLIDKGNSGCSGVQIAPSWVLTAKHCVENISPHRMTIQLGAAEFGRGSHIWVKRTVRWSYGDVALIELAHPYQNTYAPLARNYPAMDTNAWIFGWGAINTTPSYPSHLRKASVSILGTGHTKKYGPVILEKGVDGQALWGDSGGPLLVGDELVGICAGPLHDDLSTISRPVMYASVIDAASWITGVTGVAGS